MKPIYEFLTIQVELTNACIHRCSNCTRFCGHHKKPFFMDWNTFKKSIDTLVDWPRMIGIMGGEPTLHPEFERFVRYAHEKHPMSYQIGGGHKPIPSLSKYMIDANALKSGALNKYHGLGLWSSVCDKYYDHYELIQDVFSYQCINDHTASSRHQAWLMTRKEFGITDDEWVKLRDNCWWQRLLGSPSITPKGAFFCEVAAAMDMLFDGPGGWKIEKDWWKRDPDDFKDQLKWCEFCSGAFLSFDRDANESIDDVSPFMYEKLKEIGSPKLKKAGAVKVHNVSDIPIKPRKNLLLYQPDNELRFTEKNTNLYPKNIVAVTFIDSKYDIEVLKNNKDLFDDFYVVGSFKEISNVLSEQFKCIISDDISEQRILANIIHKSNDWVAILNQNQIIDCKSASIWRKTIYNPGTMHIFQDDKVLMFNVRARALKLNGFDSVATLKNISDLPTLWQNDKVVLLSNGYEQDVSPDIEEWTENIIKAGVMNWNGIHGAVDDMILRRKIVPQIDEICKSSYSLVEKLQKLDNIKLYSGSYTAICNKIKTAIHNELGRALSRCSIQELQDDLKHIENSFCTKYALAMLSIGEEKKEYLMDCILNPNNVYYLGVSTLKLHYNAYHQDEKIYSEQKQGIIPEIISFVNQANNVVLVGNHYQGKSVEMIFSAFGNKPVCFMDEERQGFGFDGLVTLSIDDAINKYADKIFLWTEKGDYADYLKRAMLRKGMKNCCYTLHQLTIDEMSITPSCNDIFVDINILENIRKESSSEKQKSMIDDLMRV